MYHYTMCGLDNVWLENGYTEKKTAYGNAVSIDAAEDLHRVIALSLCGKPHRLTGKEFRFLRTTMNMSQSGIAKLLGVTEQSVSLWERTGKVPKAPDTLTRLAFLAKHDGNATISSVIDRINTVERICHQRIVAKESAKGWTSKLKDENALAA